jgi:hypothetical protein
MTMRPPKHLKEWIDSGLAARSDWDDKWTWRNFRAGAILFGFNIAPWAWRIGISGDESCDFCLRSIAFGPLEISIICQRGESYEDAASWRGRFGISHNEAWMRSGYSQWRRQEKCRRSLVADEMLARNLGGGYRPIISGQTIPPTERMPPNEGSSVKKERKPQ